MKGRRLTRSWLNYLIGTLLSLHEQAILPAIGPLLASLVAAGPILLLTCANVRGALANLQSAAAGAAKRGIQR